VFSDVRTFWSPEAVKRVTGKELDGKAQNGIIHLINSGSSALDGSGEQTVNGNPAMKPYWEITSEEAIRCLKATSWCPAILDYFRGGGYSSKFVTREGMPITMSRINLIKGLGPVMQIAEGETVELPKDMHDILDQRTNNTWPTTDNLVCSEADRPGSIQGRLFGYGELGSESWCFQLWPYRGAVNYLGFDAAHPDLHA
jgi:L-fucose isomerase